MSIKCDANPRRLNAILIESTRKGLSGRTISTMVWVDCQPWRLTVGLNTRTERSSAFFSLMWCHKLSTAP
ncbi:Uncharacterised protein [Vibrio cholerae]|nr:Uncharacterised protein [Vibrio cholerae]CSI29961.1 Uncharacterised protein [Vibrio cholerae]CSI38346.1 Uncharacterised protein [Vibrio cholerae]